MKGSHPSANASHLQSNFIKALNKGFSGIKCRSSVIVDKNLDFGGSMLQSYQKPALLLVEDDDQEAGGHEDDDEGAARG